MLVASKRQKLERLKRYVDWASFGFCVVAAESGDGALAKLESEKPDVLIADARPPFAGGARVPEIARAANPGTRVILLGGHSQLEYMKAALRAGATDYLANPAKLGEIHELLRTVKKRCDDDRSQLCLCRAMIADWIGRAFVHAGAVPEYRAALERSFEVCFPGAKLFHLAFLSVSELKYFASVDETEIFALSEFQKALGRLAADAGGVMVRAGEAKYALISARDAGAQIRAWKREDPGLQELVTACLHSEPVELAAIPATLLRLERRCGNYVYYSGSGSVICCENLPDFGAPVEAGSSREPCEPFAPCGSRLDAAQILPMLLEAVRHGRVHDIRRLMDSFYASPCAANLHDQTMNLLDRLYAAPILPPSVAEARIWRKPAFFNSLLCIESVALLKSVATAHIEEMAEDSARALQADARAMLAEKINGYIEKNCHRAFSIDELGDAVNYSPNYLRCVYKKHTGDTILEALTRERMRRAERLLRDPGLTVREISQLVGYANPSYFCAQFAKLHGSSPQQWRNSAPL
jgi:two-component system response regulator YesN